ncbi:hypothetical protein D0Y65_015777 [Glycine soja]|uniref:Uncharacterized protein n=1 Tax=Glycine soja TaxID=3848 RepID=A0A445KE99_GLYSO|nr:hypothetical protein D0Y65_015777 [Glycine soja]
MVVECSLSLPVRLWKIVFSSEVVYTLSFRCTSLPVTVFGVIFFPYDVGNRIIMTSTCLMFTMTIFQ